MESLVMIYLASSGFSRPDSGLEKPLLPGQDIAIIMCKLSKVYFKISLAVHETLLKFGCKIATSALYVYCSLKTVQEQAQSTRSIKLTCHRHLNFLNFEWPYYRGEIRTNSTV